MLSLSKGKIAVLGKLLALGFTLAITRCTSMPKVWYKAGGAQPEFDADKKTACFTSMLYEAA
jgi:hypothetical protein